MILATVTTRNFDFTALADTVENVNRLLLAAWKVHLADYRDGDPDMMLGLIEDEEVQFVPIQPGMVLRDGEPMNLVHTIADRAAHLVPTHYVEGTYADRNTGAACWSCAGLTTGAPGPDCIYRENHVLERTP